MNQHTNRPVQREQEMIPDSIRMKEYGDESYTAQERYGAKSYEPLPARSVQYKSAWYNQGWFWLIVTVLGVGSVIAVLLMLAGEIGGVSMAIKEQTGVLREQNGLLASIGGKLAQLSAAADRIAQAIRDAVNQLLASM